MAKPPPTIAGLKAAGTLVAQAPMAAEVKKRPLSGLLLSGVVEPGALNTETGTHAPGTYLPPGAETAQTVAGRHLQMIPVERITENPFASREIYTPEMILERASNLRTQGQHDPIHVIPHPDKLGYYMIADGQTRVYACQMHHVLDALLAEVHTDMTPKEAAYFGYDQNKGRCNPTDIDTAFFISRLMMRENLEDESASDEDVPKVLGKEIAERLGLNPATITHYLKYTKLPPELLGVVKDYPAKFTYNAVIHLYRVHKAQRTAKAVQLAQRFATEDRSIAWLMAQAAAIAEPSKRKVANTTGITKSTVVYANGKLTRKGSEFNVTFEVRPEECEPFFSGLKTLLDKYGVTAVPKADPDIAESA